MRLAIVLVATLLCGCTTLQIPNYIKADHPYVRKISGDYDSIIAAVKTVLPQQGWAIQNAVNPTVYERRPDGEDQSKDILFFTKIKQHPKILYSSYTHLNVFVHSIAQGAEIEIRYGLVTDLSIKQFYATQNNKLANHLFDKIEAKLESK